MATRVVEDAPLACTCRVSGEPVGALTVIAAFLFGRASPAGLFNRVPPVFDGGIDGG